MIPCSVLPPYKLKRALCDPSVPAAIHVKSLCESLLQNGQPGTSSVLSLIGVISVRCFPDDPGIHIPVGLSEIPPPHDPAHPRGVECLNRCSLHILPLLSGVIPELSHILGASMSSGTATGGSVCFLPVALASPAPHTLSGLRQEVCTPSQSTGISAGYIYLISPTRSQGAAKRVLPPSFLLRKSVAHLLPGEIRS